MRFGGPKGLERVGGLRIIDRVVAALDAAVSDLYLAANDAGANAWLPGVPIIQDAIPGGGGLSGVHAALAASGRAVLVLAWDMPFVSGDLLRVLSARCATVDAAVPISASPVGMEPFCACYAPSCLEPLERALRAGQFGAARFVRRLRAVDWLTDAEARAFGDPAQLYFSVNTREDLSAANAMAASAQ